MGFPLQQKARHGSPAYARRIGFPIRRSSNPLTGFPRLIDLIHHDGITTVLGYLLIQFYLPHNDSTCGWNTTNATILGLSFVFMPWGGFLL